MIAAGSYQVGTISAEGTVPYPALVLLESGLEGERLRFRIGRGRFHLLDFPYPGRMVGATRCELLDIGREEDACDAFLVCGKVGEGDQLGAVIGLDELPNEYVALVERKEVSVSSKECLGGEKTYSSVGRTKECTVTGNRDTCH